MFKSGLKKWQIMVIVGASIMLISVFHRSIMNLPMTVLVRDDTPLKGADYIVLLMGAYGERTGHGGQLYQDGWGKKIIFAEAQDSDATHSGLAMRDGRATETLLKRMGVPVKDMVFLSETSNTSTFEEVRALLQYIKQIDPAASRIILVTSWYHSRRAAWITDKVNQTGMIVESAPTKKPQAWWTHERDFLAVFNEYLKWVYYLLVY